MASASDRSDEREADGLREASSRRVFTPPCLICWFLPPSPYQHGHAGTLHIFDVLFSTVARRRERPGTLNPVSSRADDAHLLDFDL